MNVAVRGRANPEDTQVWADAVHFSYPVDGHDCRALDIFQIGLHFTHWKFINAFPRQFALRAFLINI